MLNYNQLPIINLQFSLNEQLINYQFGIILEAKSIIKNQIIDNLFKIENLKFKILPRAYQNKLTKITELMSIKNKNKIIMGIDPGLATVGYGFIEVEKKEAKFITCGCIETKAKTDFNKRLEIINQELTQLIKKYQPDLCGVEQLFFCKNVKTAMNVGHARGVIIMTLSQNKVPFREFTPLQIKQTITSYGRADKKQIAEMVKLTLNLKQIPKKDDASDALAIALTTLYSKIYK